MASRFDGNKEVEVWRAQIQDKCRFSDARGVWNVIEKHNAPREVYKKLAAGVSAGVTQNEKTQFKNCSNIDQYKAFIQSRCKFQNEGRVWAALDTHGYVNDLYRVLAAGMANER